MADLTERAFDRGRDLPAVLDLVARARGSADPRAFLHPGGLQWLLRRIGHGSFTIRQWFARDALAGVLIDDSGYVIGQTAAGGMEGHLWLLEQAEARLRSWKHATIEVSVWDDDAELRGSLRSRGYEPSGTFGSELVNDAIVVRDDPKLPDGFTMRWLERGLDEAYVELHRAAWSTWMPSTYDDRMHAAVTAMPDFDRELVPIVAARDGRLAASCIAWFDPRTLTVEIEPLGTHPDFRRLGLAGAIVREVIRRSAARGAKAVMVWGVSANPVAVQLYESAGFRSGRVLREYRRGL
jgi:GNAT superfamily N-acetyltransferase